MEEENIQIHSILNRIKASHIKRAAETHSTMQVLGSHHIGAKGKTKVRDDMSHRLVSQVLKGKLAIHTIFYPTPCCKLGHSS